MNLRIHDPGHVALRRGVRAALGVPITAALALVVLPDSPAGIVAAFGSLCLIALCDFGGPLRRRLVSLLGAGVVGAVLIVIGVLVAQNVYAAVVVTFIVGTALALSPVLRGSIGSAASAMTIMYVVAVTAGVSAADVVKPVIAWVLALAVAIPITLFVLPRRNLAPVRQACAQAVLAFAEAVEARGRGELPDAGAIAAAQDALRRSYLGNPFRAAGLNHADRALVALAGHVGGLLSTVGEGRAYPQPASQDAATRALIAGTAEMLRDAGQALNGSAEQPSALRVFGIWRTQWDDALAIITDPALDGRARVDGVSALFPDRAMAVAAVRLVRLARDVLGLPDEEYPTGPDVPSIPAPVVSTGRQDVRAHLTLRSPWMRLALRTGVGLAVAVLVVSITGLAHGLWVVLGVTSILRFDGLTTMRTAAWSLAGTFAGAAIGFVILSIDSGHVGWLWAMFVAATFLAVWVPGAVGFAWGQAAFSVFVITAFTAMTWPPDLGTATDRFEDVAVGALVSVVVALLLWPGGVLRGSIANVAEAIRATTGLLQVSTIALVQGGGGRRGDAPTAHAVLRAQEVIELSLSSPSPDAVTLAFRWQAVLEHLRVPDVVARLFGEWSHSRSPIIQSVPDLQGPLMSALDDVVKQWEDVAAEVDAGPLTSGSRQGARPPSVVISEAAVIDASRPDVADAVVAAIWSDDWLRLCLQAGESCEVPTR